MRIDSVQLYTTKSLPNSTIVKTNFEVKTSKFAERTLSVLYQTDRESIIE